MALDTPVKKSIEQVLNAAMYKEYTVDLIEETIKKIRAVFPTEPANIIVGYIGDSETNCLQFVIAHRTANTDDFEIDTVSLAPASWAEHKAEADPNNTQDSNTTINTGA